MLILSDFKALAIILILVGNNSNRSSIFEVFLIEVEHFLRTGLV